MLFLHHLKYLLIALSIPCLYGFCARELNSGDWSGKPQSSKSLIKSQTVNRVSPWLADNPSVYMSYKFSNYSFHIHKYILGHLIKIFSV